MGTESRNVPRWLLPAAAIIAAAGVVLLYNDYEGRVQTQRTIFTDRGTTVLSALSAGIRAQSRMGRYRADRLSGVFDELLQLSGTIGLTLRDSEGNIIVESGEYTIPNDVANGEVRWERDALLMALAAEFGGHSPGRGGPPWATTEQTEDQPWGNRQYTLAVAIDTAELHRVVALERVRLGLGAVVWPAAVFALFGLAAISLRQRSLTYELALARERARRQEEIAQLGAGLAHETRNPLAVIRGLAQAIGSNPGVPADALTMTRQIVDESDRTVRNINGFLELARPIQVTLSPVPLPPLFEELQPLFAAEAHGRDLRIDCETSPITVNADRDLLRRVIFNLVSNSIRACAAGQSIRVRAQRHAASASICVVDNGAGIAPEDLERVTSPYFTRFPGGTGLGLSIVAQIAAAHQWELKIASPPPANQARTADNSGRGTCVCIDGISFHSPTAVPGAPSSP